MHKLIALVLAVAMTPVTALAQGGAGSTEPGPLWWRISDADSEVWIIGTPETLPLATKWNDAALKDHMAGAKMLIVPPPQENNASVAMKAATDRKMPNPKTALSQRLGPELYDRFIRALPRVLSDYRSGSAGGVAGDYRTALDLGPTIQAADFLTLGATIRERMGNVVATRAKVLATSNRNPPTKIRTLQTGATSFRSLFNVIDIPEQLQQACLLEILTAVEEGKANVPARNAAIKAWADGDLIRAQKRHSYLVGCPYGLPGETLWGMIASENVKAINEALALPGKSVAVVEFDPLLRRGGVLELLERQGLKVEDPVISVSIP